MFISSNLPGAYTYIAQFDHTHGTPCFDAAGNMDVLLCGLNSKGSLKKTEELFLQIDQINLSLSKMTQFT